MTSPAPTVTIPADDLMFVRSCMDEWMRWMEVPAGRRREEPLLFPAETAARLWRVRAELEKQVPGLFELHVLLKNLDRHNCPVCGEPERAECTTEC